MTEADRCPSCGTMLPPDAPSGVCPRCVLALGMGTDPTANVPFLGSQRQAAGAPAVGAVEHEAFNSEPDRPAPTIPLSPGIRYAPPKPHELAPLFPQLEILDLLGQGGMGAVYKARQTKLDRLVALKILPPEAGQDPAFAERFAREARTLARLNHPQIVAIHDFGQAGSLYYLVMEFVDGRNLRQLMEAGKLSSPEALAIVPKICEALQYAHDEGVVHRDIKPENILLDKKGRVKIADFGLAKMLGRTAGSFTLTDTHQVMGTPHYMAPEQIQGTHGVDHRADIYSLGVVFYEMLTGELPLGRFEPPSKKAQVDVRLDEVVLRALERSPERRYQQASEVKDDVQTISAVREPRAGQRNIIPDAHEPEDAAAGLPDSVRSRFDNSVTLMFSIGALSIVLNLVCAFITAVGFSSSPGNTPLIFVPIFMLLYLAGIPIGLFICLAAVLLARLRWFYAVKVAAFLLMLPWSLTFVLALPLGFWMFFFLLSRPELRDAFARAERTRRSARKADSAIILPPDTRSDEEKLTEARFLVRGPAIGMMVVGILAWVQSLSYLIFGLMLKRPHQFFFSAEFGALPFMAAFGIPYGIVMFVAGWQMLRLRTYTLTVLAANLSYFAWLGILPLISLPIAIWTHIVLWKPVVWDAFAINLRRRIEQSRLEMPAKSPNSEPRFLWSAFVVGLCLLLPAMALIGFAIFWTQSGWVLAALALPWLVVGGCGRALDGKSREPVVNAIAIVGFVLSLGLIAYGVWLERSAWPLTAVLVAGAAALLGVGFVHMGMSEEASKEDEDDEEVDEEEEEEEEEEETPAGALGAPAWWMMIIGGIGCWWLLSEGSQIVPGVWQGKGAAARLDLLPLAGAPLVLLGGIMAQRMKWYWLAVAASVLCLPLGLVSDEFWLRIVPFGVGLWTLVVLLRADVRAAFRQQSSEAPTGASSEALGSNSWPANPQAQPSPPPMTKRPRSTLGRAWDAWWSERDRWFTSIVQSILALVAVACMILYLNFHMSTGTTPGNDKLRHTTVKVGFPTPWYHLEKFPEPNVPFRFNINYLSWSMLVMLAGGVAWYVYWQIERAKPNATWLWLGSPNTIALFWGLLSLAIVLGGMFLVP